MKKHLSNFGLNLKRCIDCERIVIFLEQSSTFGVYYSLHKFFVTTLPPLFLHCFSQSLQSDILYCVNFKYLLVRGRDLYFEIECFEIFSFFGICILVMKQRIPDICVGAFQVHYSSKQKYVLKIDYSDVSAQNCTHSILMRYIRCL